MRSAALRATAHTSRSRLRLAARRGSMAFVAIATVAALTTVAPRAQRASAGVTGAGELDTQFGLASRPGRAFSGDAGLGYARAAAFDTNGRIVTVGNLETNDRGVGAQDTRHMVVEVVRPNARQVGSNNPLDFSFGTSGVLQVPDNFGAATTSEGFGVTVDPSNRIVAVGTSYDVDATSGAPVGVAHGLVARFGATGTSDGTFGSIAGKPGRITFDLPVDGATGATTDVPPGPAGTEVRAVGLGPSGTIVVAANRTACVCAPAIVRVAQNGALDPSFGSGGIATMPFGGRFDSIKVLGDGSVIAVGTADTGGQLVAKLTSAGALDTTFGASDGVHPAGTRTLFGTGATADSVAVSTSGEIVVVGSIPGTNPTSRTTVAVLGASGAPDPTFGVGGLVSDAIGRGASNGRGVVVDGSGRVLVLAKGLDPNSITDAFVVRYLPNGVRDAVYGGQGVGEVSVRSDTFTDDPTDLLLDSTGRAVGISGSIDVDTFRLLGDGPAPTVDIGDIYTVAGAIPAGAATSLAVSPFGLGSSGSAVYVSDGTGAVLRVDRSTGAATTVAGVGGTIIGSGVPDPTRLATDQLVQPRGLTTLPSGDLLVADANAGRVLRITPTGVVTVFAGAGGAGTGSGSAATAANVGYPLDIVAAADGTVYFSEYWHKQVWKVAGGIATVIAGDGTQGPSGLGDHTGDGGPATSAALFGPEGLALSADETQLYLAEGLPDLAASFNGTNGKTVRRVQLSGAGAGTIATFAGTVPNAVYTSTSSPQPFSEIGGIAASPTTLYVSDRAGTVVAIDLASGARSTIAGSASATTPGDGGPATSALLDTPTDLELLGDGSLLIGQRGTSDQRVRIVSPGGAISAFAGSGLATGGDGGAPTAPTAQLPSVTGIAVDERSGDLFIGEAARARNGNVLRRLAGTPAGVAPGATLSTYAGSTRGTADAPDATSAQLYSINDAEARNGFIYVTNFNSVRKIAAPLNGATGGAVTTIAGGPGATVTGDGSDATVTKVNPQGLAIDVDGTVYLADTNNNAVRRIGLDGKISTVAGTFGVGGAGADGPATTSALNQPRSVALDGLGHLYVADSDNLRIRRLDLASGLITTVSTAASGLGQMGKIISDRVGGLFIVNSPGVVRMAPDGTVTTVAGGGPFTTDLDGFAATNASFGQVTGLALTNDGSTLYLATGPANRVYGVRLAQPVPAATGAGTIAFAQQIAGNSEIVATQEGSAGAAEVNITRNAAADTDPAISPSGQVVAFASDRSGSGSALYTQVIAAGAAASPKVQVGPTSGRDMKDPAWSADSAHIAYSSNRGNGSTTDEIWVQDVDAGNATRRIATSAGAANDTSPTFSPDGTKLAFVRTAISDGATTVYTVNPANGTGLATVPMAGVGGTIGDLAWSGDGARFAFTVTSGGTSDIFTSKTDGTDLRRVTPADATAESAPAWVSGDRLVFQVGSGATSSLAASGSDGSNRVAISGTTGASAPSWVDNLAVKTSLASLAASPARIPLQDVPTSPTNVSSAAPTVSIGQVLGLPLTVSIGQVLGLAPTVSIGQVLGLPLTVSIGQVLGLPIQAQALSIPLASLGGPAVWTPILVGTALEARSLQAVTLFDVVQDAIASARLRQPGASVYVDLTKTVLGQVAFEAALFGDLPISSFIQPTSTKTSSQILCDLLEAQGKANCGIELVRSGHTAQELTPGLLELAGIDLSSLRLPSVPFKDIAFAADTPLLTAALGQSATHFGMDLSSGPLSTIRYTDIPSGTRDQVVDCAVAGINCATANPSLADVQAKNAFKATATLAMIKPQVDALRLAGQPMPLQLILTELLPAQLRTIGKVDPGDERVTGYTATGATPSQHVAIAYTPTATDAATPTLQVTFPATTPFVPGSASIRIGAVPTSSTATIAPTTGAFQAIVPTSPDGGRTLLIPTNAVAGQLVEIGLDIRPGLQLGTSLLPTVTAMGPAVNQSTTARSRYSVTDNEFSTAVSAATAKPIAPATAGVANSGELAFVFLPGRGDTKFLSFPAPAAGSQIHIDVEHMSYDVDAALYQPTGAAGLRPVRPYATGVPTETPLTDSVPTANQRGNLVPQVEGDFPFVRSLGTVAGLANKRGATDDSIDAVALDNTGGNYVLQVAGFAGASGPTPFTVRVRVTPALSQGPCPARSFPNAADAAFQGTTPSSVPAATRSLILVSNQRLQRQYGATEAQKVIDKLALLAASPKVNGLVVPVDGWSSVRAAYTAWDANPCSPALANDVVRAINTGVDTLFGAARSNLAYINLVGDDDLLPATRSIDFTERVNETTYADQAKFGGSNNARSGAFASSYLLTDDGYADLAPDSWLGATVYVPDLAVGRMVEEPAAITGAIDRFLAAGGVVDPKTAYTTGYEFLTDYAQAVDATLATALGGAHPTDINEGFNRAGILAHTSPPVGIAALNMHADPTFFEPGSGQKLTATDLAGNLSGALLFSIGCHVGLNIPDAGVTVPDFTQVAAANGANGVIANTGYGLGYTDGIGLSEQVFLNFAQNIKQVSLGQALMLAKQSYRADDALSNVWSAKALQIAGFSGIPQLALANLAPLAAPTSARSVAPDASLGGLSAEQVAVSAAAGYVRNDVAPAPDGSTKGGTYWSYNGTTQRVPGRAVQPRIAAEVKPGATDALLTDLTTFSPTTGSIHPLVATSAVAAGSGVLVEADPADASDPIAPRVSPYTAADGPHERLNVLAGQFLPDLGAGQVQGRQILAQSVGVAVLNGNGTADGNRPVIASTQGTVSGSGASRTAAFDVRAYDLDATATKQPVRGGFVLSMGVDATGRIQTGAWTRTQLTSDPNDAYRLTGAVPTGSFDRIAYFVQVWDGQLVARSSSKATYHQATTAPPPAQTSNVTATPAGASGPGGTYAGPVTVTVSTTSGTSVRIDGGPDQPYTGPVTVSGEGGHQVAYSVDGTQIGVVVFTIDTLAPTITAVADAGSYPVGEDVPTSRLVSCKDGGSGIASCVISAASLNTAPNGTRARTQTFTVNATDVAGRTSSKTVTVTYIVRQEPTAVVTGTMGAGAYTDTATVTVSPTDGAMIGVDGAAPTLRSTVTVTADGTHAVAFANPDGAGSVQVTVDSAAPTATANPGDGASYAVGQNVPTAGLVTCADTVTGVASCVVTPSALDTTPGNPRARTVTLSVVATDGAGHSSTTQIVRSYNVVQPPQATVTGTKVGNIYKDSATVTVSPSDGAQVQLDNGPVLTQPTITVSTEGDHAVFYRNADGSGTVQLRIDAAAPTVTQSADGESYAVGQPIATSGFATCADVISGVASCVVSPSSLNTAAGNPRSRVTALTVTATDVVGHTFTTTFDHHYIVIQTPAATVTGTIAGGAYKDRATVTISPSDGAQVQLDSGSWQSTATLVVTADGTHAVHYKNLDGSGQVTVSVDSAAPTATSVTDGESYALNQAAPTVGLVGCADTVTQVVTCSVSPAMLDTGVGTTRSRTTSLVVTATDAAGHTATTTIVHHYIVRQPAQVVITGSPINGFYKDQVAISVVPTDGSPTLTVDGSTNPYSGSVTLTTEGTHTIKSANVDGSDAANGTKTVILDTNAPIASAAAPRTLTLHQALAFRAGDPATGLATCTDAISGVTQCTLANDVTFDTSGVGQKTATINIATKDGVGHTATRPVVYSYNVVYIWTGFLAYAANPTTVNTATLPIDIGLKFRLSDALGVQVKNVTGITQAVVRSTVCATATATNDMTATGLYDEPFLVTLAAGATTYETTFGNYISHYKPALADRGTCNVVTISTPDGQSHAAWFKF